MSLRARKEPKEKPPHLLVVRHLEVDAQRLVVHPPVEVGLADCAEQLGELGDVLRSDDVEVALQALRVSPRCLRGE